MVSLGNRNVGPFAKLALVASLAAVLSGCSGLMYYPEKEKKFGDPARMGISHEDVYFNSANGERLHGWWLPAKGIESLEETKGTIVFFHGNAENLTSHFIQLAWITEQGFNLFIYDFPGYGESDGKPNPESCLVSAFSALDWAHKKDPRPLIVYGQSMGGAISMRAVVEKKHEIPIRTFIIDSSFPSFQGIAKHKVSLHWLTWLFQPLAYLVLSDKYAPKDLEKISPIPVLVIHGQADRVVEPIFGEEIFARLAEPKELWRVENGRHGDVYWSHKFEYRKRLVSWLESHK